MRRLDILLIGQSQALTELALELEQHGHSLARLANVEEPPPGLFDLLIDDASLPFRDFGNAPHLMLQVGVGVSGTSGLPPLDLLCTYNSTPLSRVPVAEELSGNGQALRLRAVAELVDHVALLVSRFSRDADYFLQAEPTISAHFEQVENLLFLEHLAFVHRLNNTAEPRLLQLGQIPMIERLEQRFIQSAERAALNIAGTSLTYRELHAHSRAIQQRLQPLLDQHQGPLVVGVCLPKCSALYAGILAILGSGAVYLPLEPSHPLQRQQYILENAGAVLLLHDGEHPLSETMPGLDISRIDSGDVNLDQPLMRQRPDLDAPCMALYTSGTTGHPKGVLLSQANLAHFTAWYADYVQLTEQSRALQFSSLSFDSSLIDIFPTLLQGAELIVPNEDQRRDPLQLVELIRHQQLSHAFLPPALLSILPLDQLQVLDHVMTGGDVCEPYVVQQLTRQGNLYNLYGPTEATVLITARQLRTGDSNRTLGAPIANSQVLILDEDLQPVTEQTVGELYIVGPGVCLGYLNNPQQTAERYLNLHLPNGQSLRAYRSGDMAKWTADGIELCGRRDNQVKIRGFRVEPEEIERCLRDSQLYRQVAVVIDCHRRILAFLAQPQEAQPGAAREALKAHAMQFLPDYMQPIAWTELASMPFASNGKVDRKALLELPVNVTENSPRCLPASADEALLLEIWAELLELPASDISTDESFFNLGGHSILLSRMLLRLREEFGRSISINRFIELPTIAKLATLVRGSGTEEVLSEKALADAFRELDIEPLPISRMGDVHKVIVTGANSFVGVHIVEALLAWGASEVACLVRDGGGQSAAQRFADALRENRLEHLDLSRVQVYAADITRPQLGLSEAVYERLDREFGALVHNAANVNHVLDYESLARDNVEPIFECLRLCEGRSKKIFNFVSTLSASSTISDDGRVLELPAAQTPPIYIKNGYNLSKWVGERILERARERGVRVNLYRPGNISFNSLTGVCQPHKNRLMLMLKGSIQLGQVPEFALNFDLMPVDFLARFIAFHASRYQAEKAVFNLHNPEPLSWDTYVASFREAGREFSMVSVADWQQQLGRVDSDNALFGVLGFYLNGFEEDIGDISMIGHDNAQAGVRQMGAHYPEKSPALLRRGCDYLKEINFI
ncbi:amino acid adenylation domain-containing protein/thioester reductase-like protein [Pseudomonas sp. PvR086]|jgi:amino acid adenylation domain-containing protein/thioester reductase-like protein|uniref:non-ribosomal peptide synthetase n=1 Tax=Pseudomonas TaxID=286 RepID=UPI000B35F081|nr:MULTISPECIES: non-ribosomal peptide synthetase [Pseudomonas]MBD9609788.1 non-ribosomal peptide synthetase [Pseudomonas sp. PDM08]MDR7105510.1 amino acid adenylation domain-containing protein/thioester reductase-like protein [Pseudomonas frederiksbergensis]PMY45721.1 peptide transporter [Pseudomonas sp. FW305-53]PMY83471.1 peptide transporter [Pseudomonas sp. FW303-C2]PMY89410.1 peptide transporter [Pseudomonas sp. FW305-62]